MENIKIKITNTKPQNNGCRDKNSSKSRVKNNEDEANE